MALQDLFQGFGFALTGYEEADGLCGVYDREGQSYANGFSVGYPHLTLSPGKYQTGWIPHQRR